MFREMRMITAAQTDVLCKIDLMEEVALAKLC